MLRRLTAALSTLLLLQLTLPGRAETCMRHGAADPAMSGTHRMAHDAPEQLAQGSMSHSAASPMQDDAANRSDAPGEQSDTNGADLPCHDAGAAEMCATMPACASVAALPVAVPSMGGSLLQLAATRPAQSSSPTPSAAPEPPPPKA